MEVFLHIYPCMNILNISAVLFLLDYSYACVSVMKCGSMHMGDNAPAQYLMLLMEIMALHAERHQQGGSERFVLFTPLLS